jgi:hypothetical protein
VISKADVCKAANALIDRHGTGAAAEARRHYRRVLARGDVAGWYVWARIRLAIAALQASGRASRTSSSGNGL